MTQKQIDQWNSRQKNIYYQWAQENLVDLTNTDFMTRKLPPHDLYPLITEIDTKMAKEIERKFLVSSDWQNHVTIVDKYKIAQGYLLSSKQNEIRIRVTDKQCFLTVKTNRLGMTRDEYEFPIDDSVASLLMADVADNKFIQKIRTVAYDTNDPEKNLWEIDCYQGLNEGFITAEIELKSETQQFYMPKWCLVEVTGDYMFSNEYLAGNKVI